MEALGPDCGRFRPPLLWQVPNIAAHGSSCHLNNRTCGDAGRRGTHAEESDHVGVAKRSHHARLPAGGDAGVGQRGR